MLNWNKIRLTWNNGQWKLFDTYRYQDIEIFGSLQELKEWCKEQGKVFV